MIINGDFTSGNSGFTSQYGYQINLGPEGYYYVGTNPNICNSGYSSCPDHTTGSGNMMIVNGAGTPGIDVWCETIPVTTNSDYNFSTWATSMNTGTPAILQFSINGQAMGSAFTLSTTPCAWSQFFSTWNSGANSTANICIVNQNTSLGGNDFALDDIAFSPLCSSTDSVVVTINLPPNAQVSPFTPATCGLNNGSATATGGSIYLWSNAATTATATGLAPGSYTVTVTNISGCSATASVTINNTPVPTVTSTSTNENCNQSNGTSTAVVTNGALPVKYSWSDAKTTQTITNLTAGVYTVTITDANGCTCFTTDTVTNLPGPSVSIISATNTTCGSANGGAVANAALGNSPYTYKWSNAQTGANLISVIAGTYTVTVTDANNCKATNSVTLTNTPGPTASITATIASDCGMSDGSAILNVTGGTQPYTFNWNSTPSEISQNLINVPKGDYIGIVTDSNGCTFTVSAAIAQNPGPTVTASSTSEICGKGNGTVTALAAGGMGHYTYLWSTNATDAVVSGLATGTYTVSISDGGCSASTSIFVGEIPGPVAGFIIHPKLVSVLDNQVYFADNSTGSVIIWDWSLGDNYYEYVSNFSHNYINVGSYPVTLIVTDTNGCKDEITDTVKVKDVFTFYIPNAFSPNDDEINDGFTPQGTNVDPAHFEMYIFDRWGNLMFHTTKWYVNSAEPWNGTLNNSGTFNDAVMDTYVYKIVLKEIEGPNHEYVGKITIVE
jgi:gliding motility-associated-like protein